MKLAHINKLEYNAYNSIEDDFREYMKKKLNPSWNDNVYKNCRSLDQAMAQVVYNNATAGKKLVFGGSRWTSDFI
jgi:hypothetical protein